VPCPYSLDRTFEGFGAPNGTFGRHWPPYWYTRKNNQDFYGYNRFSIPR
jgi:hypothetical protein